MRRRVRFWAIHVPPGRIRSAALTAALIVALAAGLSQGPGLAGFPDPGGVFGVGVARLFYGMLGPGLHPRRPAGVPDGLASGVFEAGGVPAADVASPAAAPLLPERPVYGVPLDARWVGFAVNLDWGAELVPDMLAVFEKYGARVTFFPTGRFAGMEPDLIRTVVQAGHEVGNHGWRHDHPKALDDGALRDHIVRARDLLRDLTGAESRLYAPPYGEVDDRIARIAAETAHWTIMWTIDTVDWQRPHPEVIVRRVVPRVQPGAIVLMHPTEPTLAALPTILESLVADGWRVVPVGALLERAGASLSPGETVSD